MGAWGTGLLESDEALDLLGAVKSDVHEDLLELEKLPTTAQNALIASGIVGLVALLEPEWLDLSSEVGSRSRPEDVSEQNALLRKVLTRLRLPLLTQLPKWKSAFHTLVEVPNQRLKNFAALRKQYENGEDVDPPWAALPEDFTDTLPKLAFSHPQSAAYAQMVLDRTLEEDLDAERPQQLAAYLWLAVRLRKWTRVAPHHLKEWKRLVRRGDGDDDDYGESLARECRTALEQLARSEE